MSEFYSSDDPRNPINAIKFRELIEGKAEQIGLRDDIRNLNDLHAIRLIQTKEGFTPCFGAESPLVPSHGRACGESRCIWRTVCNSYRTEITPIDKALINVSQSQIEKLRKLLLHESRTDLNELHELREGRAVGINLRSFAGFESITKKLVLGSPQAVVSETTCESERLGRYLIHHEVKPPHYPVPGGLWPTYHTSLTCLYTADLAALHNWLENASGFLKDGTLRYRPLLTTAQERVTVHKIYKHGQDTFAFPETISFDLEEMDAPHLAILSSDMWVTNSNLVPILNLELPVLEGTDLPTLHKVITDYPEAIEAFRDFLQGKAEEVRNRAVESETFYADVKKIEREIRDELRKLKSSLEESEAKATWQGAGIALATWTLALVLILNPPTAPAGILQVLGPSGLSIATTKVASDFFGTKVASKKNPAYLLWILGKTKRK